MAKKYITLKEAAKISGYSADYLGQLIRSGKIPGRQVYVNVAWMTTEDAVREYAERREEEKNGSRSPDERMVDRFRAWKNRMLMREQLYRVVTLMLYAILGAAIMLVIVLFYAFSVQLDKRLEEKALQNAGSAEPTVLPVEHSPYRDPLRL